MLAALPKWLGREMSKTLAGIMLGAALALAACGKSAEDAAAPLTGGVVTIYAAERSGSGGALADAFTKTTGIRVQTVEISSARLVERLKAEGQASRADVILASDAGELEHLRDEGLFQPLSSSALEAAIPARLRDRQGYWFGFSLHAHVVAYSAARQKAADVDGYDKLAGPALRGKLCLRSSSASDSLSLLAARIARRGAGDALAWAKGMAANFAREPQGSDADLLRAIAAGACDVSLVNHDAYLRLLTSSDPVERGVADKAAIVFPDQQGDGAHVNVFGGGVARFSKNPDGALKYLEFLASPKAQAMIAELDGQFPIAAGVKIPAALKHLAGFKEDDIPLAAFGENQAQAQKLFEEAGWR